MNTKEQLSAYIKQEAASLGFAAYGIAPSEILLEEAAHLDAWLGKEFHAGMGYMERNREARINTALLVENAKSVIVFLYNYSPAQWRCV